MKMENRNQQIDDFFNKYSDIFNKSIKGETSDIETTTELYSDAFIGANPKGVLCGKNDKALKDFLIKGYDFYKKIGITSMEIASKEITTLDEFHTMTKVRWKANYTKKMTQKEA